jgi:uncharacterized membrane protein (UPF0127 family)
MNRRYFLLLLPLLALPLLAMSGSEEVTEPVIVEATIYTKSGERPLRLELAASPKTRETGLMNRQSTTPYDGMLFVFPTAGLNGFWMKDTKLPLDILFISEKHKLVDIAADMTPYDLTPHIPPVPVIAAIELDGGRAARDSIGKGDHVRYALPPSVTVY